MRWSVVTFKNERYPLLTSDRPIIMTNGLVKPGDHLALPIGPLSLFVATNDVNTENAIKSMNAGQLIELVNHRVSSQACQADQIEQHCNQKTKTDKQAP